MKKRKDIYLTIQEIKDLERLRKRKDLSISELIRRAIDNYVNENKNTR